MQYFQFDQDGNMFVYEAGAGFSSKCYLVRPGEDINFDNSGVMSSQMSDESFQIDAGDDKFDSHMVQSQGASRLKIH